MASWNLPLIRSAAEAILIGLFPFVMILAMLGGIMAFRLLSFLHDEYAVDSALGTCGQYHQYDYDYECEAAV